jgi:predicted TIM-barrel fold metal-dependent hydrolase
VADSDARRRTPLIIDAVCNLFTPEVSASRPAWAREFHSDRSKVSGTAPSGVRLDEQIEAMRAAGIDHALLIAPRLGYRGLEDSWELAPEVVAEVVAQHPDLFRGLIGINPEDGVRGVREIDRWVTQEGFVGVHLYPHWFGLRPDDRRFYPFYAKCCELDVPIQMQVGRCQRYSRDRPMRNVGYPEAVDTVACDFPELRLVGIHVGWPWTEEMIAVAARHENVLIGTDAYAPKYLSDSLIEFISGEGRTKVLFGTDWPVIEFGRAVDELRERRIPPGPMDDLLAGNALRIYRLDDWGPAGPAVPREEMTR